MSAVTAACLMVRKAVFDEVGGFDENLAVAYNDVDFVYVLARTAIGTCGLRLRSSITSSRSAAGPTPTVRLDPVFSRRPAS